MVDRLKSGGMLIVEAFNPIQNGGSSGGLKDFKLFISKHDLAAYFSSLECVQNEHLVLEIKEGEGRVGIANIVRYVGVRSNL
ncbi:MAG: hypothetical protein LBG19_09120 [Prevotellaceae bacterium]|jgi:hypothetical protein|nr:hypothetical protein [Prevotellaceae bacterium]